MQQAHREFINSTAPSKKKHADFVMEAAEELAAEGEYKALEEAGLEIEQALGLR